MSAYTTLLPTGTLILGAVMSETRSWLAYRRSAKETAQVANLERIRERETRRETFELDLLTKLTEAMLRFGRATGRMHMVDLRTAKDTGVYAGTRLPTDVNEEAYQAGREVLALMNMVLQDDLRAEVRETYQMMTAVGSMTKATVAAGEAAFFDAITAHQNALKSIAIRIRAIYLEGSVDEIKASPGPQYAWGSTPQTATSAVPSSWA